MLPVNRTEGTVIATTADALVLLVDGDRVFRTNRQGAPAVWQFVSAMLEVSPEVIQCLRAGYCPISGRLGGRLVPLGDGLFPGEDSQAQTWGWKRQRSFRLSEQDLLTRIRAGDRYWSMFSRNGRTWEERMRRRLVQEGQLVKVGAKYTTALA